MKYVPYHETSRYKVWGKLGEPIQPPRFIYHLDFSGGRYQIDNENLLYKRLNIAREGLMGIDMGHGGVWANIYQPNPYGWFPIILDRWDYDNPNFLGLYDVWRIDTSKIKNKWYIDPNMSKGEVLDLSKVLYTPDTVSGKSLRLFHMILDMEIYVMHDGRRLAPFQPFHKINNYIRFIHRRKRIYKPKENSTKIYYQ